MVVNQQKLNIFYGSLVRKDWRPLYYTIIYRTKDFETYEVMFY